jgi:signal transduction histidine kinase
VNDSSDPASPDGRRRERTEEFVGMVAHDMRNLLNGIVLSLELMKADDAEPPAHVTSAAARIRRYVARLNALMVDLVDVTSIESGTLTTSRVATDAAALVRQAAAELEPAAREKGLSLLAEAPARPLLAALDPDRVLQVLANLLRNAIQFTPAGGRIVAAVEEESDGLRFTVADTGVGIPADRLESVFDRVWKAGAKDRKSHRLGLYLSKCIVEAQGGRIWAESEVGKGSRFHFTVPLSSA